MPGPLQQRPIKGLNKGTGEKRFVFKSFSRRIEEVDVDVFRSLAPVKFEPREGASFFLESLVAWRELNSAADFNAIYEELLPIVQTLPQLLLHKELIINKLLSRLQLSAILSLEPILSLIAILSRDFRADFIPFIPRFLDSCVDLFQSGGDREPEIIEQVFTSLSYVLKYMQKLLSKDIGFVLKATKRLRYYHQSYIQEFAAESVSYLLRNTSLQQLVKGTRRIVKEVVGHRSKENVTSCSSVLWHTLKGPAFSLHSRAEPVLRLLLDISTFTTARKKDPGGEVILKVISETFCRLCEELDRKKLSLLWACLIDEIHCLLNEYSRKEAYLECEDLAGKVLDQVSDGPVDGSDEIQDRQIGLSEGHKSESLNLSQESEIITLPTNSEDVSQEKGDKKLHLAHVLSLLNDVLEFRKGSRVDDFKPLFDLAHRLLQLGLFLHDKRREHSQSFVGPSAPVKLHKTCTPQIPFQISRLILALVKSHCQVAGASIGPTAIVSAVTSWASVWNSSEFTCLLPFVQGLLEQDAIIIRPFAPYLLRTFDRFIDMHPKDVLPLMMDFFEKLGTTQNLQCPLIEQSQNLQRLISFVPSLIEEATRRVESGMHEKENDTRATLGILALEPAIVWAALQCYPYILLFHRDESSLAWNYTVALDRFLSATTEALGGLHGDDNTKHLWEYILATALSSELKVMSLFSRLNLSLRVSEYLDFAVRYRHSPYVLKTVADFLDTFLRDSPNLTNVLDKYPSELTADKVLAVFENNLGMRNKLLRLSTLRILSQYEPCSIPVLEDNQATLKRQKGIDGRPCKDNDMTSHSIFKELLSLEAAPFCLEIGRQSSLLLARVKVHACTGSVPECYLVPLTHAVVGVLHNRFGLLWDAAIDCLAGLLEMHSTTVWGTFIHHLQSCQKVFLSSENSTQKPKSIDDEDFPRDIWSRFESSRHDIDGSTDAGTVVTLLLRAAQKVPRIAESRSRQLMPLFLAFVGHVGPDTERSDEANTLNGGKDWKCALKEWLNLLNMMRNARSYFQGLVVKDIMINRFLMDGDPDIQLKALECLLNWKDNYLTPYEEHLKNLISPKMAREEMTTWNMGKESQQVQDNHREGLIPVILRLLFPKILKSKAKLNKKAAGGVQRKAILSFLGHLEVEELASFFVLLLKPLESAFTRDAMETTGGKRLWEAAMDQGVTPNFIEWVDGERVASLSYKKKAGFLHMVKDALETFDGDHLGIYLNALLAFVFRILQTCEVKFEVQNCGMGAGNNVKVAASQDELKLPARYSTADEGFESITVDIERAVTSIGHQGLQTEEILHAQSQTNLMGGDPDLETKTISYDSGQAGGLLLQQAEEEVNSINDMAANTTEMKAISGTKELRSLAFKVLASVFSKYDDLDFSPVYWEIFFRVIKPLVIRFGQESASSDTPSALFLCFLAMSRSLALAPVLQIEEELVPNLVSLVSHRNASSSVVSAALSFVENIFNLENEGYVDDDKEIVSKVLLPHLSILLSNIQDLLLSRQKGSSGKRATFSVKRGLRILIQLSKYIKNSAAAVQLLDVLLPFLIVKKRFDRDECVEVLNVIKELSPALNAERCGRVLPFLGPLLASSSHQDVRSAICQVLGELSRVDTSLCSVARLLADLNALSESTIGEYDYDRRLQAYGQLSATLFSQLSHPQALLIISHAIYDMASDDISIRHSSSNCLSAFVHFLSTLCSEHRQGLGKQHLGDASDNMASFYPVDDKTAKCLDESRLSAVWPIHSIQAVVQKVLLLHIRKAMGLDSLTIRKEWVALLRDMALNLPDIDPLSEFLPLVSTDSEVDFFNNINHIQTHRRIKAMLRFKELCSLRKFSQGTLVRIFSPLFMNSIFEAKGDRDGNLVQCAVEILASIAAQLQWDPYYGLLMRIFRLMMSNVEHEKVLVRLVCSILDKFHFYKSITVNQETQEMQDAGTGVRVPQDENSPEPDEDFGLKIDHNGSDNEIVEHSSDFPVEILKQLQKRVLPEFSKLMVSKTGIVNVSVALAVVKILHLMPEEVRELELPRIIQNIVNLLKSRSQAVRDEARSGLVAVMEVLGARYVGFVVDKLQISLTRGYEVHVLGFTLNAVVAKLFPSLNVGEIDYCIDKIMDVLGSDIFGGVSEEKEVEKIAIKMKETKKTWSFESMRLVAQTVTFQMHAATLLKPVRERLRSALAPKIKNKIERVLRQIALGIQANPSLKQEELLVFVHGLVEDGIMEEKLAKKVAAAANQSKIYSSSHFHKGVVARQVPASDETETLQKSNSGDKAFTPNQHLITEFALHLLENHLKRVKVNKGDPYVLSMLDPMVGLLQDCLESKYGGVLGFSMKCLCHLLRLPLTSIGMLSGKLINLVLSMAQRFGKGENPLAQACFNVLISLLKHAKGADVTEDQLRMLLQFPVFVDLGMTESNTGLLLLKAVVGRKLLVPELYDMMNRVAHLMVTSHAALVRQYCSQILLQFLLDYPLGFRRLQQHLDFFVANLSYEHASGREAVLEMLHTIIMKFPDQAVDEQSETLFLPLVTRLVNDDANNVRAMVGAVLKVLMGRVSQRSLQRMLEFCSSWLKGDKHQLWRPSSQVLGFLIEVMRGKFSHHIQDTLASSVILLKRVLEANAQNGHAGMTIGSALWQEAYYTLTMLEKLLRQFPDVCLQKDLEELWDIVCSFLLHQHVWLRKVSCRLLHTYFTACGSLDDGTALCGTGQESFLLQPSRLMLLAAILCEELDTQLVDEVLAEQIKMNLIFVARTLYSIAPSTQGKVSWMELVSHNDASAQPRVVKALSMLQFHTWNAREGTDADMPDEEHSQRDEGAVQKTKYFVLLPVFKRLEKISLRVNDVQTKVILHWYDAITTQLGGDGVQPYLLSMMVPLYKITEGFAAKNIPDDMKTLAEDIMNHIKEVVGTGDFVKVYNEVRQIVKSSREERRRIKKLSVLVDPEGHAKRKIKLTAKRQAQKKKKKNESKTWVHE